MSIIVLVMMLIGITPISICLYFYCRRMITCIKPAMEKSTYRKVSIGITCLWILPFCIWKGTWLIILFHMLAFLLLFQFLHYLIKKFIKKPLPIWEKVYRLGVLPLLCTALLIGYGFYNMQQIQRVEYTITTNKQIDAPLRIGLLSDLHYGTVLHQEKLAEYVEIINQEEADVIVLDGDIVDESTTYDEMKEVFQELAKLKATYGVFYIYGNHDESMYRTNPSFNDEQLSQTIRENGITILADETYKLRDDVTMIGRKDATLSRKQGRMSSLELLEGVDSNDFLLLLDHQPKDLKANDEAGYDLQLSGHTHGGQIWPMGTFAEWFGFMEEDYGYRAMDHMQVVVSSGFSGWGFPLRTQAHNEYVILNITSTAH